MHRVYSHFNPAMVQLAKNELERRGIDATIRGEHLASIVGGGAAADAWHELWVLDGNRLEEAMEVIQEVIEGDAAEAAEPWTCPRCGEEVEGTFAICWKCGYEAPSAGAE